MLRFYLIKILGLFYYFIDIDMDGSYKFVMVKVLVIRFELGWICSWD